jgi:uncharacterized membrane protein
MNKPLHHLEDHPSYRLHRKQLWTQILLPILIAALVFIAVIITTSLATFRGNGDVNRWAAISTIWLILPILVVSVIVLILLIAMIYLMGRLTALIPPYSLQAQRIVYRIEDVVKHVAEMVRKPVHALQELATLVKMYIEKVRERM